MSVSLFIATKSVRSLQLTCSHFFNLIERLFLKMPVVVGSSFWFEREESICNQLLSNGYNWKVNKFYILIDLAYKDSAVGNFIDQIRSMIDSPIKMLYFNFSEYPVPHSSQWALPDFRNAFFSLISEYCNASTEIIVNTPAVSGSVFTEIGVPKIDSFSVLQFELDNIPAVIMQDLHISHLILQIGRTFDRRADPLPDNPMRCVTSLLLNDDRFIWDNDFFIKLFPALKVLRLNVGSGKDNNSIQLPDCCETVYIDYRNLRHISGCRNIKYLGLRGSLPPGSTYFDSELMESLQFFLHGLNLDFGGRNEEDHDKIEVDLQRLLKYQTELKVLSVLIGNIRSLHDRNRLVTCKINLIDAIRSRMIDFELFIFGNDLAVINRNLPDRVIKFIDKLDCVNGWQWRRRGDRFVSLDPRRAALTLPL